jgi:hypothetical protein
MRQSHGRRVSFRAGLHGGSRTAVQPLREREHVVQLLASNGSNIQAYAVVFVHEGTHLQLAPGVRDISQAGTREY